MIYFYISLNIFRLSIHFFTYCNYVYITATGRGIESENAYVMNGKDLERKKREILSMKVPTTVIKFKLEFEVTRDFGIPGAFVVENRDKKHEFFLKSVTLHYINNPYIPEGQKFRFYCGSWVYPITKTGFKRIFFSDQVC